MIDADERIARLRLFRSGSIGPITFYRLLSKFGSAQKALEELPTLTLRSKRKNKPHITTVGQATDEIAQLEYFGGKMVVFGDDEYPTWLSTIDDAPPVLSCLGDISLLSKSSIAIVGARNASANGKKFTKSLAYDLGKQGQVITSGLARGIDTAAHEASLEHGTIAVMAGGIDQVYPSENKNLYADIAKQGCIVSEMPYGTPPTAHHFPRRNRIVSGLSKGVIVIEASLRSGSLITARLAGEQGREVFAVPSFPGDPRGDGPNSLIQNGAKLVRNVSDVMDEIIAMNDRLIQPKQATFEGIAEEYTPFEMDVLEHANDTDPHETILENLTQSPLLVDDLCRSCDISIQNLQICLLDLELSGEINRHPGNRVSRAA